MSAGDGLPVNPALAREVADVDRMLVLMAQSGPDLDRRLALAQFERSGVFDRDLLPARVRPRFEDLVFCAPLFGQGDRATTMLMVRVAFHVTRIIAGEYEQERHAEAEPPEAD